LKSLTDPHVAALVAILRRRRTRISLTYLAYLAGVPARQLWRLLELRPVIDAMRRYGWTFSDSKTLGLPALEAYPFSVQFLVRN
jgi:hypothetical protein